jgi:hypothetical protein
MLAEKRKQAPQQVDELLNKSREVASTSTSFLSAFVQELTKGFRTPGRP